jgi:threonylcarbamoyladenosine tRNA methylthiotransferase MtaB
VEVIREVRERVAEGYREVVLTGTKIGAYWEEGAGGLASLVRRVLDETGVERLRLSSLQPQEITPDFLSLWREGRLCPHLHMSLQSGSDAVLHRMGRRYTAGGFRRAVESIRQAIPDVAVTTDVIVGFPGETDLDFDETYRFCEEVGFARIHVFPFSARPGTPAMGMRGQVDQRIKRERALRMGALAGQSADRFARRFLGQTMSVLWERETGAGRWSGLTGNYLKVFVPGDRSLVGACVPARLEGLCEGGLHGELAGVPMLAGDRRGGERDE